MCKEGKIRLFAHLEIKKNVSILLSATNKEGTVMNRNEVSVMVHGWEKAILSMSKAAEETASSKSSSSESAGASREELKEMIQCLEKTAAYGAPYAPLMRRSVAAERRSSRS